MALRPLSTVSIGPFSVADAPAEDVTKAIVDDWVAGDRPVLAFSLHVGGLLHQRDERYVQAMNSASVVYADGAAIVLLARRNGASRITRCPTTDHGHRLIDRIASVTGRPTRVALVGGPPGLAERAGAALRSRHGAEIVFASNGYQQHWDEVVLMARASQPDVVFVGLGTPFEKVWGLQHASLLGHVIVNTCGGWFGFVAGDERRAPHWMITGRLEWLFRLFQDPRRLAARYLRGLFEVLRLLVRRGVRE